MVSKIVQKTKECAKPTADEQAKAIRLLIKKHHDLVGTQFDLNGHVHGKLVASKCQTIDDYADVMSDISG